MDASPVNSRANSFTNRMRRKKLSPARHNLALSLPTSTPLPAGLLKKGSTMESTTETVGEITPKREGFNFRTQMRGMIKSNEFALLALLLVGGFLVYLKNPRFLVASNIGTLGRDIALIGI